MPDKNYEWHTMNILIEDLNEKEGLNLEHVKKLKPPDPDFSVEVKRETIGIEVTRFSAQGNQFESNSLVDRVLECGRQIFRDKGGPALYVSVHFSSEPRTKHQAKDLGKRLARVVQIMLEHKVKDSSAYSSEALCALFSEHDLLDNISDIYFENSIDGKNELW